MLAVQNIIYFKLLSQLGKTSPLHRLRIGRAQTVFSKIQLYSETLIQRDKGGVDLVSYLCVCVCLCLYKSIIHTDLDRNINVYTFTKFFENDRGLISKLFTTNFNVQQFNKHVNSST